MPDKIQGIAIIDATTVAAANDNDCDIGKFFGTATTSARA
jgi:hypothetical protein